jgi:hypothetical protein
MRRNPCTNYLGCRIAEERLPEELEQELRDPKRELAEELT